MSPADFTRTSLRLHFEHDDQAEGTCLQFIQEAIEAGPLTDYDVYETDWSVGWHTVAPFEPS
jgi:hypothetical protein